MGAAAPIICKVLELILNRDCLSAVIPLLVLIWVQTVYKDHQQTTKFPASRQTVKGSGVNKAMFYCDLFRIYNFEIRAIEEHTFIHRKSFPIYLLQEIIFFVHFLVS